MPYFFALGALLLRYWHIVNSLVIGGAGKGGGEPVEGVVKMTWNFFWLLMAPIGMEKHWELIFYFFCQLWNDLTPMNNSNQPKRLIFTFAEILWRSKFIWPRHEVCYRVTLFVSNGQTDIQTLLKFNIDHNILPWKKGYQEPPYSMVDLENVDSSWLGTWRMGSSLIS